MAEPTREPASQSGPDAPERPEGCFLVEFAPLLIFLGVYKVWGIYAATGVFMVTSLVQLAYLKWARGKIPPVPIVTTILVLVLGGLTIALEDETFIKIKMTVVNGLFAATLLVGQLLGKPLIKPLLGSAVRLTDQGWRVFTWFWVGYFLFVAALNEVVRRAWSTDAWVNFKVFGVMGMTMVFMICLFPVIKKYEAPAEEPAPSDEPPA